MKNWKDILIYPSAKIIDAIKVIDSSALQIAIIVDKDQRLLGMVTDGDIRRGILRGVSLERAIVDIMNTKPVVAKLNDTREVVLSIMKGKGIAQIPIVNDSGIVEKVEFFDEIIKSVKNDNTVVLMAGGVGSRMGELTADCPKPLLRVGGKPILEIILENFVKDGFGRFYISVNYRGEMIENYFGDGSKFGCDIFYIRESKKLGTAGALSLLPKEFSKPLVVMNGDLLTKLNFNHLLNFHVEHNSKATVCVCDYRVQIPFGVIKMKNGILTDISEKPMRKCFVNAGIYIVEPDILAEIPVGVYLDMPDLFKQIVKSKRKIVVFPLREYWFDVGYANDFERANKEYTGNYREC